MSGVRSGISVTEAAAQLLSPREEQGEHLEPEQESPEEETLEASGEEELEESSDETEDHEGGDDDAEVEDSEVGDGEDEDQGEGEEELQSDTYTVKVDGEEREVSLDELKKGFQLEANYTKKSQQLAEEQKQLATVKAEAEAARSQYTQAVEMLAQQANGQVAQLKNELAQMDHVSDPIGYMQKQIEVQKAEQAFAQQAQAYQQAQSQQEAERQQQLQAHLQEQAKLLSEQFEGWAGAEGEEIRQGIAKFASGLGYTDQELSNVHSARDIIVLDKARRYDELMAKKTEVGKKRTPQKASPKVKSAKPTDKNTSKARSVKEKRNTFQRSGSVKDAQKLLTDLMSK